MVANEKSKLHQILAHWSFVNDICEPLLFQLMLDSWNQSIFSNIKHRLQDSAMKLVHAERNGEAFDSQLVIGVRESYGRFHYICI